MRDEAIDAVRGLCIFSMVIGHICFESTVWRIVHPVPWIDGASGFVLVSGLVLGMVSRRRVDTAGVVRTQIHLARRMALLYVAHVAITTLAVAVSDNGEISTAQTIWWLATMQINPDRLDILSMYVALLGLAAVWISPLSRRWWPVVVVSSTALYVVAIAFDWGRFPNRPDGWAYFNTAAWQALFGVAFLAGWHWSRLRDPLRGRAALLIASGGGLVVAMAGIAVHHFGTGAWLFDKATCGLGRIALALAIFVVLYQMMRLAIVHTPALVTPIAKVGSRSLACFVVLSVVGTLLPLLIGHHPTSAAAQIAAVLTLLAMYPVARARDAAGSALTRCRQPQEWS